MRELGLFEEEQVSTFVSRPLLLPSSTDRLATAAPAVTTPPITRKRKALEAALDQGDGESHACPTALNATLVKGRPLSKTRKTGKSQDSSSSPISPSTDAKFPVLLQKRGLEIATPTTTTGTMDSDDDFMTDASSQEGFLGTQGSDDESLGDGKFEPPSPAQGLPLTVRNPPDRFCR